MRRKQIGHFLGLCFYSGATVVSGAVLLPAAGVFYVICKPIEVYIDRKYDNVYHPPIVDDGYCSYNTDVFGSGSWVVTLIRVIPLLAMAGVVNEVQTHYEGLRTDCIDSRYLIR